MKANELRIGNLCDSDGSILTIRAKHILNLEINESGWCTKPLILTEEWLVTFGFRKHGIFFSNNTPHQIAFDNNKFWFMGLVLPIGGIELKYVHQLQNLYFALTGEELELK